VRVLCCCIVVALIQLPHLVFAQTAQAPHIRVSGSVVDAETSLPLAGSRLTLVSAVSTADRYETQSQFDGAFEFSGIPSGKYRLGANLVGYLPSEYGSTQIGRLGTTVVVSPATSQQPLILHLVKGAMLSGTARDRFGAPTPGLTVSALFQGGATGPAKGRTGRAGFGISDDLGRFRIVDLPPGEYFVVAAPRLSAKGVPTTETGHPEQLVADVPIYYPGTARADSAVAIRLAKGETRSDVDLLVGPAPVASVSGRVLPPPGRRLLEQLLQLTVEQPGASVPVVGAVVSLEADGSFALNGLIPGTYELAATGAAGWWARAALTIGDQGQSPGRVELTLAEPMAVTGVLKHAAGGPPRASLEMRLTPLRENSNRDTVPCAIDAEDLFSCARVVPGWYRLDVASQAPWLMTSLRVGTEEAAGFEIDLRASIEGLEATVEQVGASVSGQLVDRGGLAAVDYFVVVLSTEPGRWVHDSIRQRVLRPASDGSWQADNLPPGDYYVAVVADASRADMSDGDFLQVIVDSKPMRLALRPLERRTVVLQIGTTSLPLPLIGLALLPDAQPDEMEIRSRLGSIVGDDRCRVADCVALPQHSVWHAASSGVSRSERIALC